MTRNAKTVVNSIELCLINIQGLTKQKLMEIESNISEKKIYFLTETQQKYDKLMVSKGLSKVESNRDMKDKKGGGLMIIYNNNIFEIEKMETEHKDILYTSWKLHNLELRIILVYFSSGNTEEDKQRDKHIRTECERLIQKNLDNKGLIVLGDFNGHVGFIGSQKVDRNGEMVIEWMSDYDLTLLNGDEKCEGQYTWGRQRQKSAIDFVLMNKKAYKLFKKMEIDEDKDIMDLSDHNLITVTLEIRMYNGNRYRGKEWEEIVYFSRKETDLDEFTKTIEGNLREQGIRQIEDMNKLMSKVKEDTLARKYKRKIEKENKIIEPPWMNREIRNGIKERKELNRRKRNEKNPSIKDRLEGEYLEKKKEVQRLVKDQITIHEKKKTREIRENKGTKLWENIDMLRNNNKKREESVQIYNEQGEILEIEEAKGELIKFWEGIYGRHENNIDNEWNEEKKKEYEESQRGNEGHIELDSGLKIPWELREHYDMILPIQGKIKNMKEPKIDRDKTIKCLKKLKKGKSAGPDGLRPEYYKALLKSDTCINTLVECFANELEGKEKPKEWKMSKTKMIEKKRKPTAKDLRPIALTNVSYKIYMALIKEEIEEHLKETLAMEESQAGFTEGGRIEDNIFLLQYCVEESYKNKKELIVASIDFKKAFDSIKRESLIEILKEYKVHHKIISTVADIYVGDKTVIDLGDELQQEIAIESGIKQGCTGSTTLFKLITYKIIKAIQDGGKGFKNGVIDIGALFFADDALILADSIEDIIFNIKKLIEVGQRCGLDINKDKSNIIIYNKKEKPEEIEGIRVVETIKYLGIKIDDKRNMFKSHKTEMNNKANRLANLTYAIIEKSCNKVLIGKTYWKCIALPSILYGTNVLHMTDTEISKLQKIENSVYRKILGGTKTTAVAALRGDVGASAMKSRVVGGKLQYIKSIYKGKKDILKKVLDSMRANGNKWWKSAERYIEECKTTISEVRENTKEELKEHIRKWDSENWKRELENKNSLSIYKLWKREIKEEEVYDNRFSSILLFRARSGTLKVNWQNRHSGGSTRCQFCINVEEDLVHFIIECPLYSTERSKVIELQQPYEENKELIIGKFLFEERNIEKKKETLYLMWKKRESEIETRRQQT